MASKERLKANLFQAREMTEAILEAFQKPEDWTHQVHPQANHALWIVGHLGHADNFFVSMLDPSRQVEKDGWGEKFGMGSQPTNDPAAYPPVAEVLDFFRDRRAALLEAIDAMSDEDLAKATPDGSPDFLADFEQVLELAYWHEGVHSGQLTVAHRALGNPPLFSGSS
ncbi:MAG: DinB family protein [Planctomycetota bacterium]|mgnify:CR=1 FL=1|nr:MAG: DinB family protein [Planctomycetota bacterium]REJ98574.1 MAG: DinB family protein [Planctomycetota bacterium]REK29874.1 MAG: DinB family protein [Planctomycetota bacterium]REK47956.1 MAG: DinB family protein [Planctomycetota bacterium]